MPVQCPNGNTGLALGQYLPALCHAGLGRTAQFLAFLFRPMCALRVEQTRSISPTAASIVSIALAGGRSDPVSWTTAQSFECCGRLAACSCRRHQVHRVQDGRLRAYGRPAIKDLVEHSGGPQARTSLILPHRHTSDPSFSERARA